MAKITSNEFVRVVWIRDADMTASQAAAPTATLLNSAMAVNLSPATAWQDWALGATDSDDVEDRGITDPGNATTRGFANFEGTLSFFRDANPEDTTSDYVKAWETFKVPRTYGYLVLRVAEKHHSEPFAPGDRVSVFRFVADAITDDTEGDDSVKFTVNFLPQGVLHVYTVVAGGSPVAISGVPATASLAVGGTRVLRPTLSGSDIRAVSRYVSSSPSVASVSPNGVVKGLAAGTSTVTVTHPSGTSASVTVTVA